MTAVEPTVAPMLPTPSERSGPFWSALATGAMSLQRCTDCAAYQWPPQAMCAACFSTGLAWTPVSGAATLVAATVIWRAPVPQLRTPYVMGLVRLAEGPVLVVQLLVDHTEIEPGMALSLVVHDHDGHALFFYEPAGAPRD